MHCFNSLTCSLGVSAYKLWSEAGSENMRAYGHNVIFIMLLLSLVLTTSEELCLVCDSLKEILRKQRLGPDSKETCSVREGLPKEEMISLAYLLKVLCYLLCKQHSLVPYIFF